jgi:hypothetical protein
MHLSFSTHLWIKGLSGIIHILDLHCLRTPYHDNGYCCHKHQYHKIGIRPICYGEHLSPVIDHDMEQHR